MTGRRMGAAVPLEEMTEKTWSADIARLARTLGHLRYHTYRSERSPSGYPDEVFVRDRVIHVELKRELTGKASVDRDRQPTAAQREWLTALAKAGAEVYVWRPSDLEEAGAVLGKRWRYLGGAGIDHPSLSDAHRVWTPGSLWLPAGHRHDATIQETMVA